MSYWLKMYFLDKCYVHNLYVEPKKRCSYRNRDQNGRFGEELGDGQKGVISAKGTNFQL